MKIFLEIVNGYIWGIPLLLIIAVGFYLTCASKFAQVRLFPHAIGLFIKTFRRKNDKSNGISGYRALCTALSATVGTGNIAGVAGAIAIGGPGAIFWMWVCAVLGMVIKFAEIVLAIRFRKKNMHGEYFGGPMYTILGGLPQKYAPLAFIYAFFGVVASFGIGNTTQVNAISDSLRNILHYFGRDLGLLGALLLGLILTILVILAFNNGANGVGVWAEKLIPAASLLYIILSAGLLILRRDQIPAALQSIFAGAFRPSSATGGVLGSMAMTMRVGAARGVFTNEAGMGTASIAHAAADVANPAEQGLMGSIEVFLDTILICTLTGLAVICSGVSIPYGTDPGVALTMDAFSCVYGKRAGIILSVLVCLFAFATILGWGIYGIRCAQFLFGEKAWNIYLLFQVCAIFIGIIMNTSTVWILAEIVNGLMTIPNLIAIILLAGEFLSIIKDYEFRRKTHSLN